MKYNEESIEKLYQQNLTMVRQQLASLPVAEEREPNIKGLNGWVYEQTIRYCLSQELSSHGLTNPSIDDQVSLFGRAKVDLLINNKVAIEIKALGFFGKADTEKYKKYRAKAEEKGWKYFYLTRIENHNPFREKAISIFGKNYAFFLDTKGDWARFIREVAKALKTY